MKGLRWQTTKTAPEPLASGNYCAEPLSNSPEFWAELPHEDLGFTEAEFDDLVRDGDGLNAFRGIVNALIFTICGFAIFWLVAAL